MIFLAPVENDRIIAENGLFLSTEMAKEFSKKIATGELSFSKKLLPVHLPYKGLITMDFGRNNNLKIQREKWLKERMPPLYNGENLSGKKVIIFPMHGLGDQMYLAVTLRFISEKFPGVSFFIVRSSIAEAEKWYPYIYFSDFFNFTGPVLTWESMQEYDYYINAEHFAHLHDYKGSYPPDFYAVNLFCLKIDKKFNRRPSLDIVKALSIYKKSSWASSLKKLRSCGKPIVFVNSSTTGRVRDIPDSSIVDFIERAAGEYSFVVSVYGKPSLEKKLISLMLENIVFTSKFPLDMAELIGIVANCDLVITPDSGITHIAEASETLCGSVFNVVTPEERTLPYNFSEQMMVNFELPGVCKTPCYVHAIAKDKLCPGMAAANKQAGKTVFYDNSPCMAGLQGEHLSMLLCETLKLKAK